MACRRRTVAIEATVKAVRDAPNEVEATAYVYVLDPARKPVGVISLRELLLANAGSPIAEVMFEDVIVA